MIDQSPSAAVSSAVLELQHRYRRTTTPAPAAGTSYLQQYAPLLDRILHTSHGVAILDLAQAGYCYISPGLEQLLGYPAAQYLEGGVAFTCSITHHEDLPGRLRILERELDELQALPALARADHHAGGDYRLRRADGEYVRVWQRTHVLDLDEQGHPCHLVLLLSDISHLRRDDSQLLTIGGPGLGGYTYHTQHRTLVPTPPLSRRELQVLRLLSRGYSSRQLADELCISVHTVETHRRHLLAKTNTRDTSSMVSFVLAVGLLGTSLS